MRKYANKNDAIEFANENNLYIGWSVFTSGWFVGTFDQLKNIGVIDPEKR